MVAPAPDPRSAEASAALRAALDDARVQMRAALESGASGNDVCAALSDVYDRAVAARWRSAVTEAGASVPVALVATGGWGRREMAPYSDIDFILLHRGEERTAKAVADRLLYPLWDARVAVGHAVREPRAAARLARDDLATATALLDVRHLAGDPALTHELISHTRAAVAPGGNANAFVADLAAEKKKRHDHFGDSLYLLEPNLKQGIGALRDLATALWAAAARWSPAGTAALRPGTDGKHPVVSEPSADVLIESLVTLGHLTRRQAQVLHGAHDFLLRVRAWAQVVVGRRTDQLTFEIQEAIAPAMFPDARLVDGDIRPAVAPAVEALMRCYYLHARGVVQVADRLLESARVPERRKPRIARIDQTFLTFNGEVAVSDPRVFAERPAEMLRIFRVAVAEGLEVYGHTKDLIAEQVAAGGTALTGDPTASRHFLEALVDPRDKGQPSALEVMHQLGLLNAVMPEWAPCTCRVQHDLYHVYTVDQHQLYAVAMLKRIARGELAEEQPVATAAYATIRRLQPLYLGTLLHDVGKPLGKGHAEKGAVLTSSIARRLGLSSIDAALAELLVRQHLTMAHLSQRRDLSDADVVVRFASRIGDQETLSALYLLTLCDAAMTNPDNLTAWKDELMRELYLRGSDVLRGAGSGAHAAAEHAHASRDKVLQLLESDGVARGEAERFLAGVDPRFVTQLTPRQAARTTRLALRQRSSGSLADVAVSYYPMKGHSEVAVVAPDVPGALAAIAGALTANRIDVLGAVVGHADDGGRGLALDLFFVRDLVGEAIPEDDARWRRLQEDLRALFADAEARPDQAEIGALIARRRPPSGLPPRVTPAVPTEIHVLNEDSDEATIVEVFTRDRVGVLYAITHTLAELGLDISLSKVSTEGEKVADVFYVTRDGAKLTDPDATRALVEGLRAALEGPIP